MPKSTQVPVPSELQIQLHKLIGLMAKNDSDHLIITHKSGLTAQIFIEYPETSGQSHELH